MFCPPDYPPELENALKRAVAIALTRANMGVIKNLCGLNWIIEPLGAEIRPIFPVEPVAEPIEPCDPSVCVDDVAFEICNTQDWIYGMPPGDVCETLTPLPQVPAYWDRGCDKPAGLPDRVWPGVLAAECIIRSMMPNPNITRCC